MRETAAHSAKAGDILTMGERTVNSEDWNSSSVARVFSSSRTCSHGGVRSPQGGSVGSISTSLRDVTVRVSWASWMEKQVIWLPK